VIDDGDAIIFGEAAPDSIWLLNSEGVLAAGLDHWAGSADRLGSVLTVTSTRTTFAIWMEEEFGRKVAACALVLPLPFGSYGPWKSCCFAHIPILQPIHRLFKPLKRF